MSRERLARNVPLATPTGKRTRDRTTTRWCDYISDPAWYHLYVEPEVAESHKVFWGLGLLPPSGPKRKSECGKWSEWRNVQCLVLIGCDCINCISLRPFRCVALTLHDLRYQRKRVKNQSARHDEFHKSFLAQRERMSKRTKVKRTVISYTVCCSHFSNTFVEDKINLNF